MVKLTRVQCSGSEVILKCLMGLENEIDVK